MLCFDAVQTGKFFAKNVARAGKRGNICVRNNVSSFARAFILSCEIIDFMVSRETLRLSQLFLCVFETVQNNAGMKICQGYSLIGKPDIELTRSVIVNQRPCTAFTEQEGVLAMTTATAGTNPCKNRIYILPSNAATL